MSRKITCLIQSGYPSFGTVVACNLDRPKPPVDLPQCPCKRFEVKTVYVNGLSVNDNAATVGFSEALKQ